MFSWCRLPAGNLILKVLQRPLPNCNECPSAGRNAQYARLWCPLSVAQHIPSVVIEHLERTFPSTPSASWGTALKLVCGVATKQRITSHQSYPLTNQSTTARLTCAFLQVAIAYHLKILNLHSEVSSPGCSSRGMYVECVLKLKICVPHGICVLFYKMYFAERMKCVQE